MSRRSTRAPPVSYKEVSDEEEEDESEIEVIEKEGGTAVQRSTADGADEMPQQA